MSRDAILQAVRTAIGRKPFQKPVAGPEPLLQIHNWTAADRLERFRAASAALGVPVTLASSASHARELVAALIDGRSAIASLATVLAECGILGLAGVQAGFPDAEALRHACASTPVGITSAWCLLAETGTIVLRSSPEEPRLLSLLPPVLIVVVSQSRLLENMDEFFGLLPQPADSSSATVMITGSGRHELHVILVGADDPTVAPCRTGQHREYS